jgi:hypothetical protein
VTTPLSYSAESLARRLILNLVIDEGEQILDTNVSKISQLLQKNTFEILDGSNEVVARIKNINNKHFFPLTLIDYANAFKNLLNNSIPSFPIISVDSHDHNLCDFKCEDCLSIETQKWNRDILHFKEFEIDHYKSILKEIARYSLLRKHNSVRLEFSGEGNPDLYEFRKEIIKYAVLECNMKIVYVSSGSKLNDDLVRTLVKYASYIRISLPGLGNEAYKKYSRQDGFTYDVALNLLYEIANLRYKYNRKDELMIGIRTCIRPENENYYLYTANKAFIYQLDSFQIVKVLISRDRNYKDYKLDKNTINELQNTIALYSEKLHISVPDDLDYIYYDRAIQHERKQTTCYSSMLCPILYGPNLVVCTHEDKIKDIEKYHYKFLCGDKFELEDVMMGERADSIRENIPFFCQNCCSISDNIIFNAIRSILLIFKDSNSARFRLV